MPKGPRGERRPADVVGAAVMVAKIATGEIQEALPDPDKEQARKVGSKGGKTRALGLSADKRKEIAKKAAKARWGTLPVPAEEEQS